MAEALTQFVNNLDLWTLIIGLAIGSLLSR